MIFKTLRHKKYALTMFLRFYLFCRMAVPFKLDIIIMLKSTPKCPNPSMKYSAQLEPNPPFPNRLDQSQNKQKSPSKFALSKDDACSKRSKLQNSLFSSDRFCRRSNIQSQSSEKPDSKADIQRLIAQLKQQLTKKPQEEARLSNASKLKRQNSFTKALPTPTRAEKRNNISFIEIQAKLAQYNNNNGLVSAKSQQKFMEMSKSPDRNAIITEKSQKCRQLCEEIKRKLFKETVSTTTTEPTKKGLSITDFKLQKLIGQGKFSKVYISRHKKTGFLLAIKIIKKQTIIKEKFIEQLIREIKIQSFLNHVNLVKLYSFFQDKLNFYLLLEYCAGGQLYNIFKVKSKLREEEWQPIMKGICQGLYEMHRNCVIHRDLKPQNIVMCFGLPKIADFGWSVYTQDKRETFCGTPLYISPQLLLGNSYDNQVDIWALGVMMYEFLTGKIPFKIQHEKNLLDIVNSQVTFPRSLGKQSSDLLKMILEKDPNSRIGILDILQHPFLHAKLQSSDVNFFKISR